MPTPFLSGKLIVRSVVAVGLYVPAATQISSVATAAVIAVRRSVYAFAQVVPLFAPAALNLTKLVPAAAGCPKASDTETARKSVFANCTGSPGFRGEG